MVRVPEYSLREVAPRPDMQQGIDVRATPGAFGADIGQGMQQIGKGLGQAADAFARLRDFDDSLAAKDALTAFEREKMELDYGPNGYLTTQGRDAVDGRDKYNADLEALKKKYGSTLKGGAALKFNDAATEAVTSGMRSGIVHSAQGRKDWASASSTARLATFQDQALTAFRDPKAVDKSIAAGFMEIDAQADLMGWDADVVAVKRQEYATGVYSQVALAMAGETGGATRALEYLASKTEMLDPATKMELEAKLKPYANDEAAMKVVDEILAVPRGGGDAPAGGGGPRRSKAFLSERSAHKDRPMDTLWLDDAFADNLAAMIEDAPPGIREGLGLGSAFRTREQQEAAYANARPGYAAKPGGSQHEYGRAVDLTFNGVRLDKAPADVQKWVHDNAAAYGLYFPMLPAHREKYGLGPGRIVEEWHIEPLGTRGTMAGPTAVPARDGVSSRAAMASYYAAIARVNEIEDPEVRASAMKQLNAQFEMRSKAESAAAAAAKSDIWSMVAQGTPMSQIPLDLKIAAGREAVQGFMDYEAKAGEITTDPILQRNMTLFAAMNPIEFAKIDLTSPEIINGLSKTDLKSFTEKQASVLSDERKAREEGLNVTQAMTYAKTQLEAVGITSTNLKDGARQEMAKREAQFQMALADEMRVWSEANGGKKPTQMDIMQMTNRLLLPIVIKTPGTFWDSEQDGLFSFEAGSRADGTTVDVVVEYNDIPLDLRRGIGLDLERELGRKPSEEEIVQRYEEFILSR
jgi:hypothetical protein